MSVTADLVAEPFVGMPTLRGGAAVASCGGKIYVIGGGTDAYNFLNTVECYDPKVGTWRKLPPLPTPRGNLTSAVLDGKIYAIGGLERTQITPPMSEPSKAVEIFDTASEIWSKAADLPGGRVKPAAGAVQGKVCAISGRDGLNNAKTVLQYDPADGQWNIVAESPVTVRHPAACVWDDKLYFSGGGSYGELGKGKTKSKKLSSVWEWDPVGGGIRELPEMKAGRATHAMFAHAGSLYVLGGVSAEKKMILEIDALRIDGGAWETVGQMSTPRAIFEACVVGDTAYVLGGWTTLYKDANRTADSFRLGKDS